MKDKKIVNKVLEIFNHTGCTVTKITTHTQGHYDENIGDFIEKPIYVLHLDKPVSIFMEDEIIKTLNMSLNEEFMICGNGDWISQF